LEAQQLTSETTNSSVTRVCEGRGESHLILRQLRRLKDAAETLRM
jgi:hypothetical protein